MIEKPLLYFKKDLEWRAWLLKNHHASTGVHLAFYKVKSNKESMRWEEAVKVALCFGWIDSTVKKIDDEKRKQYFSPRNPKSAWSKLNKTYIKELMKSDLMHQSGLKKIAFSKTNGSWTALDAVENLIVPTELQTAFKKNAIAFENYTNFSPSYRKGYLYWLHEAKREATRERRIAEIIRLCKENIKSRDNW